jgi:SAM-dependent methyltransferase
MTPPHQPPSSWRADTRRSVELFRSFRYEQSDPDRFYYHLGADGVGQLMQYADLDGALVLDVGGGPGHSRTAFEAQGARYLLIDPDLRELASRGVPQPGTALGDGHALPVRTGSVDVCFSSNVLEHVADPESICDEMLRVTRCGGILFVSYTLWLSPHGGHETAPYHLLLGGRRAADYYARRHGVRPKNEFGVSLFPHSAARMLRWADAQVANGTADLLDRTPRYHPGWARWVLEVPGVREIATWNVLLVLRRRSR